MITRRIAGAFAALTFTTLSLLAAAPQPPLLWYNKSAAVWTEALPVGNGRLGAMVFGNVTNEHIQFNEDTLWTGKPHDYVRAGAREQLPIIRRLVATGHGKEAGALVREKFLSDPVRQKAYQPFGDLYLTFPGLTDVTGYRRELDLDAATARTTFQAGGVTYTRDVFASFPDQVIALRLTASQGGRLHFTLQLNSPHTRSQTAPLGPDTLALTGQVQADGLRFESRVRVLATGGQTTTNGNVITVTNADSATVLLSAATSFKNFQDISADPAVRAARDLAAAGGQAFDALQAKHLADHRRLFRRVSLDLGRTDQAALPTNERLKHLKRSGLAADPALASLYLQYGRYLLITSSRPGSQPANLQGVWNDLLDPPWESKWTVNINCQMNYWPAEIANLSECHEPLFDLIDDLVISGSRTARDQYGCRGWVLHHNTDLWRGTAPINNVDGVWPTGGAWLCYHLWEHYLFTGDTQFLTRAYPALKEASLFFVDYLVKDSRTGWLVTTPSFSPEQGGLCRGPTMDNQIIRALLSSTIEAAAILKKDKDLSDTFVKVRAQLPPNQVGQHGQLQEWLEDVDHPRNNHRHMSPLWALYPGADITPADPKVYHATKLLLEWRGDGSTGWSFAWRIPLWARVGDGDFAYRQLAGLLEKRTLPNLFDLCGPFQIDGNFGAAAGIVELLLQSHITLPDNPKTRQIDLLPALPKAWPTGSVTGLCARGGFEVDLTWAKGQLTSAVIRSKLGGLCHVRYGSQTIDLKTKAGAEYHLDGTLHSVAAK